MQQQKKLVTGALSMGAILSIVIGALAMLGCAAFMFSSKQIDVMGAGLGIVAGAILFGSGLICLAILASHGDGAEERSHSNH